MNEELTPQTLSHFNTIDAVAADVISKLTPHDYAYIKRGTVEEARSMHHGFGTWIRNTYGLWHDNELTRAWRENPEGRRVRDGTDQSCDHPDAVSDSIIQRVWMMVQGSKP